MARKKLQSWAREAWRLEAEQHGVVTRRQLLALGMPRGEIDRRRERGRLHRLYAGVYAVGRPEVDWLGRLKAATLACGPGARLSGRSAADLWEIRPQDGGLIDVTIPSGTYRSRAGIRLHRRVALRAPRYVRGIPLADPVAVLVDLASELPRKEVEDAVNEADRLGLVKTGALRAALGRHPKRPGVARLRALLDAQTYSRSQSELERQFREIVRAAGLPLPQTQRRLGRYRVDFFWPEHHLVVETDSLRHHRTAAEQTTDLGRDHAHLRAGLRTLRFSHSHVFHRPEYVTTVLADTLGQPAAAPSPGRSPTRSGESSPE
jgi:very-short-patch-repair endonuclease